MSIRVRWIKTGRNESGKKKMVARCAAKYKPLKDDMYLDDNVHYALYEKLKKDLVTDGLLCQCGGAIKKGVEDKR